MPGPSSWPCNGSPASSRNVSRAPSPAGSIPASMTASHTAAAAFGRHRDLDPVLARVARSGHHARRAVPVDARPRGSGRRRRHRAFTSAKRIFAFGPCTAITARSAVTSTPARRAPPAPGRCSTRWHDVEAVLVDPPHDDVVEHRRVGRRRAGACTAPGPARPCPGRWSAPPGAGRTRPGPSTRTVPRCETSNATAPVRHATCSAMVPAGYDSGISHPPKGTSLASSGDGRRRAASASASPAGR